jgi:hypothetical protein
MWKGGSQMTNPSSKHVLVLVLVCLMAIPGIHQASAGARIMGDWPVGVALLTNRVDVQEEDPFVEYSSTTLIFAPLLREILDNATYWAQQNMNETQHWIDLLDRDQILFLLTTHYTGKYGMNASQYAATYNTTFANPVVKYGGFYFLFRDWRDLGHPIAFLITHVDLPAGDPYVDWNCTDLQGWAAVPFEAALQTAVAWAEHAVEEIVQYFAPDIYHSLTRRFDYAYEHKYGMTAHRYSHAYNTTFFEPIVAYHGYYFRFRDGVPCVAGTPALPNGNGLFVLLAVSIGLALLTVTVAGLLRRHPHLTQQEPQEKPRTSTETH